MRFRYAPRKLLMLLATSALLLGIPAAATAYASSATTGTGWIRLAHLSPNTPAVDVYLYSFGNPNAMIVLHHVAYGTVSPYESVQAGDYSVAMRATGASPSSQPVLSTSVTIAAGPGQFRRRRPADRHPLCRAGRNRRLRGLPCFGQTRPHRSGPAIARQQERPGLRAGPQRPPGRKCGSPPAYNAWATCSRNAGTTGTF